MPPCPKTEILLEFKFSILNKEGSFLQLIRKKRGTTII